MRRVAAILAIVLAAAPAVAATCRGSDGYAGDFGGRRTFLWRPDGLETVKAQVVHDPASVPAYGRLIADANAALDAGPWSVTGKTRMPPSGDVHDYMSLAPYWWPDPKKPDGLPYIRRDGEVDPERDGDAYDRTRLGEMADAVEALGLAYYLTGDERYARRAALDVRTWFLDPKTRMNPSLTYAQGAPGTATGRSFGIIDSDSFIPVVEAIGLVQPSDALSDQDMAGLRGWFGDLAHWMTTSANGREERAAKNNHGIYYDLELSEFSLFSGDVRQARKVAARFGRRRLAPQMAADGSLPQELARTRSFHYSLWTLQAIYDEAGLSECTGGDIWNWKAADGRSLRLATAFAASWAGRERDWRWQEIAMDPKDLYDALLKASRGYRDPALGQAAVGAYGAAYATARINLTTPPE